MKKTNYKDKSRDELMKLLVDTQEEFRKLQFQNASGQLKDVRAVRIARKTIARINTALAENKIA